MKKYIAFLLCLIVVLSLFSCKSNQNQNENTDSSDIDGTNDISEGERAMERYPITAEQAWNLANEYWDHQDGRSECSAGTIWTAQIVLIDTPNSETDYYRVAFQVEWNTGGGQEGYECMPPYDIQLKDQILVNAFTGEVRASTYDPNGKGVSVEEAIEIAKNYETYMSGEICNEENGYRVEHIPDAQAPDHVYVIIIKKYDTVYSKIWIDKNTGKTISPYYLYGKG